MMNKYYSPKVEIIEINTTDVITASPGTETPVKEVGGGIWDLEISIEIPM